MPDRERLWRVPIGSCAPSVLRRGDEQFEIVSVGIQEVDTHTSDRVSDVNIKSYRLQVCLPGLEVRDGRYEKRDMVEAQLPRPARLRPPRPHDKFKLGVGA